MLLSIAGPVLELLDSMDLELRILATATAANVLSFSDSLLLTNKECIDAFFDSMEDLLSTAKRWATVLGITSSLVPSSKLSNRCIFF